MLQSIFKYKNKKILLAFSSLVFLVLISFTSQAQSNHQGEIIVYQTPQ
jgi:hypothetical protein